MLIGSILLPIIYYAIFFKILLFLLNIDQHIYLCYNNHNEYYLEIYMKQSTKQLLLEFLQTHFLNDDYTFIDLFKGFYAEKEFSSKEQLLSGINEFFNFLKQHIPYIRFNPNTILLGMIPNIIESSRQNILNLFNEKTFKEPADFVSNVSTILGSNNVNLLDVGPSPNAASSLLFANKIKKVTAMDSHFYLSIQALKNMNVVALQEYFNKNTPITDYDIIVGRAPCTAIKPIVENCTKENKPYFLLLCDCALPDKLKTNSESLGWENVLPEIDPKVRFHGRYAFNIDATPEQVKHLIKDYTQKNPTLSYPNPLDRLDKKTPSHDIDELGIFY